MTEPTGMNPVPTPAMKTTRQAVFLQSDDQAVFVNTVEKHQRGWRRPKLQFTDSLHQCCASRWSTQVHLQHAARWTESALFSGKFQRLTVITARPA